MGVQNLWQLVLPIGRRINLETLEGKALAVDVSIWLIQFIRAMRDEEGKVVKNAHLIGTLRRILKLLYHRIKPVFVFDGGTPELKRKTVQSRRVLRERQESNLKKAAEKILVAQIKQAHLLAKLNARGEHLPSQYSASFQPPTEASSATNTAAKAAAAVAETTQAEDDIEWEDAEIPTDITPKPFDNEVSDSDEDVWVVPDNEQELDIESLSALPAHIRKELIFAARRKHRLRSRADFMPVAEDPALYSQTQIANFLRTCQLNKRIFEVQKQSENMTIGQSIAASSSRKFIMMKSIDNQESKDEKETDDEQQLSHINVEDTVDFEPPPELWPDLGEDEGLDYAGGFFVGDTNTHAVHTGYQVQMTATTTVVVDEQTEVVKSSMINTSTISDDADVGILPPSIPSSPQQEQVKVNLGKRKVEVVDIAEFEDEEEIDWVDATDNGRTQSSSAIRYMSETISYSVPTASFSQTPPRTQHPTNEEEIAAETHINVIADDSHHIETTTFAEEHKSNSDVASIATPNIHEPLSDKDEILENNIPDDEPNQDMELSETVRQMENELDELHEEEEEQEEVRKKALRDTDRMTEEMKDEVLELLRVLGMPYIIAPMEAEAQCAMLEQYGIVDGVVTEDSDAFLFGAKSVYKNIFDERKYVEVYLASDAERELGVSRATFIALAYLLGSDYTPGVRGVGIVNAMEILHAFPCNEDPLTGLSEFKKWLDGFDITEALGISEEDANDASNDGLRQFHQKHKGIRSRWQANDNFPDPRVAHAYFHPQVNESQTRFEWPVPELVKVREYCMTQLGWTAADIEKNVVPSIARFADGHIQRRIDSYYVSYTDNVQFARIQSTRLKNTIQNITGAVPEASTKLTKLPGAVIGNKKRNSASAKQSRSKKTKRITIDESDTDSSSSASLDQEEQARAEIPTRRSARTKRS